MYEFVGIQPGGLNEIVGLPAGLIPVSPHFRNASYPTNRPGMGTWRAVGAAGSGYGFVGQDLKIGRASCRERV